MSHGIHLNYGRLVWALFVAALWAAMPLFAQVNGTLTGRVVDASGAAVPGATVSVYLPGGKSALLTARTTEAGVFAFLAVRPARYDVAFEANGFAKTVLPDVKVDPVRETSLGSLQLEVKSASQVVDVTTEVHAVQLANAEVSSTITTTQVENLPLLGRQASALYSTQPGVNATSDTTSINGLRSSFSALTLDGINVQDNYSRTNDLDYLPLRTTIDQIAEITVISANAGATIGGGASQVVLSTKSGSNDYHGAAYWFNRNSALGANDWFNNQSRVPLPVRNLNQAGVALGGRLIRDKLFFYTNYEAYRNKQQSPVLNTVLTDTARQGIFQYRDTAGNLQRTNLLTLRNFSIDPTIQSMISQLPEPNSSGKGDGLNTSGYLFNARSNENRDQLIYKVDYYLSPKQSVTATYNYISDPTDRYNLNNETFYTTVPPVANQIHNHLLSVGWRSTPTATLTNEARFGFFFNHGDFLGNNKYPSATTTGLIFTTPVNGFLNQGRSTHTYMLQDNANWVHGKHVVQFGYQSSYIRIVTFNDSGIVPLYTMGFSAARSGGLTGADLLNISSANLATANSLYASLAGFVSSASRTFNVTSSTSGYVQGATNRRHLQYDTFAGYLQDNWKLQPHLTASLGLRYEIWTPISEPNSLFLAPNLENGNIIQTLLDPNAVLNFAGGSANPLYKTDKNNFAPNIGLAWDPVGDGKTSIRAGYMIAYANDNVVTTVSTSGFTAPGLSFNSIQSNLVASFANPPVIPAPAYKIPRTLYDNYLVSTSAGVGRPDPGLVTPYAQQWTIGIQHEFKGTVFEARYLGNHGTKLIRAFDFNQVLYNKNGFLADFQRAQSNLALSKNVNGAYNPAIPGSQPLTIFPLLPSGGSLNNSMVMGYLQQGQVGELANLYQTSYGAAGTLPFNFYNNPYVLGANDVANGGDSSYHALQLEMRKRALSGLQYQFSYSFSKNLSNTAGDSQANFEPLLDLNNPNLERARTPYDLTHSFKANFYYELPFGEGKKWHGNRATNLLIGGWALSGIWAYVSGEPYSIVSGLGTLNRNARSLATNTASVGSTTMDALNTVTNGVYMTGNGPYFVSPSVIDSTGRGAEYGTTFNGEVFFNPAAGTVGNTQRRMFNGPWQQSWDMSAKKDFRLYESSTLDLHFDFFNFLNHPTFLLQPTTAGDYGSVTNANVNNTTFGKLTSMNYGPRVIQIGAYYRF